jgi:hypothetical protein
MRPKLTLLAVMFGFSGLLLGAGCPGVLSDSVPGTGTLKLLITDKPFPIDLLSSAEITITRVEVRLADGSDDESTANYRGPGLSKQKDPVEQQEPQGQGHGHGYGHGYGLADDGQMATEPEQGDSQDQSQDQSPDQQVEQGEDESPSATDEPAEAEEETTEQGEDGNPAATFITIFEGERTFDLLDLQNGRAELLADVDVPAGQYDEMRLIVASGRVVLTDGREFDLTVPSGAQTGIKLHFTFEVQEGQEAPLLLDVDLSRAFKPIPSGHIDDPAMIREFKFQPSLGMRLISLLEAGSISGIVTDSEGNPLPDVLVTAYAGDDEVTSTTSETDGTYRLVGLYTAQYRLEFSASGYVDAQLEDVAVTAGEETTGADVALSPAGE